MFGIRKPDPSRVPIRDPRLTSQIFEGLGLFLLFSLAIVGSFLVQQKMGPPALIAFLVILFVGSIYTFISFRNMSIPLAIWILSVGGFRFLVSMQVPGLPDLYLDRIAMIWLTLIFMVKFFAEGRSMKGPIPLDILVLLHGSYILVQIIIIDSELFNLWTKSYLMPYAAFFLSKNIVTDIRRIRLIFLLLLGLGIYYNITSIAEKLDFDFLLIPRTMAEDHDIFKGRSNGPFRHAPLFGTVIGMLLPIHLYFMATTRNFVTKLALFASFGMGAAALYFTYTRGSWLVGIVAIGVTVMLNMKKYFRMVAPLVLLLPILGIMVLGVGQDEFLKERLENENTLDARVGTIMTAVRAWQDNPVFGVGFFQYPKVRLQYVTALDVPILGTINFRNFRHNSIHDIYFGPLAEEGLVGVFFQFGIYFLIVRTFLRKFAWRKENDPFALLIMPVFAGMLAGYLVGGIAIDYRFFSITGTLFFMVVGIMYGYSNRQIENTPGNSPPGQ